ncbi:EEF1A lysine methyltransferase 3-like [Rhinoraja longicauda]
MTALLKRVSLRAVHKDENFSMVDSYHVCGFLLEIGVRPFSELGFGTAVWGAGRALCHYFEKQKIKFSNKKVIELGAGTGMLGILAVLLGGEVTITDRPGLLKNIERNVSANVLYPDRLRAIVSALSWGYDHTLFPSDYDFILGGDILYDPASVPLILRTLQHLSNERTTIYFASSMSIHRRMISFTYQKLSEYFHIDLVDRYEEEDINVYRMTKIGSSYWRAPPVIEDEFNFSYNAMINGFAR